MKPIVVSVIALFSHGLCYFNSAINPVIYNFMSGKHISEQPTDGHFNVKL